MWRKRNGRDLRLPARLRIEGWPDWVVSRMRRFAVYDPAVVTRSDVTMQQFQRAMFGLHVGGTVKITWSGRQHGADQILSDHLPAQPRIVEIGASDGSTAIDLISQLGDSFRSYAITDRFLRLTATRRRNRAYLFQGKDCVLVSGRFFVLWPNLSSTVRKLLGPSIRRASRLPQTEVLLLNPAARELVNSDQRVTWREQDLFEPLPEPVEVIKVGNLLRRCYFGDQQLRRAIDALHAGLVNGGVLLLTDHADSVESAALYRRTKLGFQRITGLDILPEVDGLVMESIAAERIGAVD